MSSVDTIVAALRQAVDALHRALAQLRVGRDMAADNRDLCEQLAAQGLVERFTVVVDTAERVEAMLLAGIDHGHELIAQTEAIRGGAGAGTSPAGPAPVTAAAPAPAPALAEVGRGLPVRSRRDDPTVGAFNGERIHSSEDEATVADLHPFPGGGWPRAIISHVESHVAARMRRQRLTEGNVVLNNRTCGTRDFDRDWPMTCDRFLPSLLPSGSRLTVWSTQDGGTTWLRKTYVGTGERIRT